MKEYIKPSVNIVELRSEETFGCGSIGGKVTPDSAEEVSMLKALGLNTHIFVQD